MSYNTQELEKFLSGATNEQIAYWNKRSLEEWVTVCFDILEGGLKDNNSYPAITQANGCYLPILYHSLKSKSEIDQLSKQLEEEREWSMQLVNGLDTALNYKIQSVPNVTLAQQLVTLPELVRQFKQFSLLHHSPTVPTDSTTPQSTSVQGEEQPTDKEIRRFVMKEVWCYEGDVQLSKQHESDMKDIIEVVRYFVAASLPHQGQESEGAGGVKEAVQVLCAALNEDKSEGSYYYSWQANIAMAFYDEYRREIGDSPKMNVFIHEISNNAAKNFLDMLINLPTPPSAEKKEEVKDEHPGYTSIYAKHLKQISTLKSQLTESKLSQQVYANDNLLLRKDLTESQSMCERLAKQLDEWERLGKVGLIKNIDNSVFRAMQANTTLLTEYNQYKASK